MQTQVFHHTLTAADINEQLDASRLLANISGLSRTAVKDAMSKGAAWLKRGKSQKRLRRSTFKGVAGDVLSLHHNPDILALIPPLPELIADERQYSVWVKPAGLLAQGSLEGDHCSLLRLAELQLQREVKLVHRLDREAAGLMLIAHTGRAAAAFSALFATGKGDTIRKGYRIRVKGVLAHAGEIASLLDGKSAVTRYRPVSDDGQRSWLDVDLITGRKHQIRRHFAGLGYPVLGDPQYGQHNKDPNGLQLFAVSMGFTCPLAGTPRHYIWTLPDMQSLPDPV